jgi:hypothetical protein
MRSTFREQAGIQQGQGGTNMSDQDRDKLVKESDDLGESTEDVEAHVKAGRGAAEEADEEVRAHVKGGRGATDDDSGDDVEAHVKAGR